MLSSKDLNTLLSSIKDVGEQIKLARTNGLNIEQKNDKSFVTNADKAADISINNIITNILKHSDVVISEEAVALGVAPVRKDGYAFWSVDPIDSTKTYMNGGSEYCICVAHITNNTPDFGLIYAPDTETYWYGIKNVGAFKKVGNNEAIPIYCRTMDFNNVILMSSEEQIVPPEILLEYNVKEDLKVPSAIKFTYIAEGKADLYFRKRNKACDWDIAAGHAIIVAAGGSFDFIRGDENFKYGVYPYEAPSLLAFGKKIIL